MKRVLLWCGAVAWGLLGFGGASAQDSPVCIADDNNSHVLTCDHQVPHISTVPANVGELVHLFVRERVASNHAPGKAVLMIHGLSTPALPAFDLRADHYDWALWLAQAGGLDVFMLDFQGSGLSPFPDRNIGVMKDPCNVPLAQQSILIPNPLSGTCPSSYAFQLINSQSDWSELDSVVDYIRDLRGVDKVALVSWSQGSLRIGPYAVQHPEKVDSLLFLAPIYNPEGRAGTGPDGFSPPPCPSGQACTPQPGQVCGPGQVCIPQPGTPMTLQTRNDLMMQRWGPEIQCQDQVEDGIQDLVWNATMDNDSLGRTWGPPPVGAPADSPPEGIMRVRAPFLWGWNASTVSRISGSVPVLIIVGTLDRQVEVFPKFPNSFFNLYETIPHNHKLLFRVDCAGHMMNWERQRRVLHHISKEWLNHGAVEGFTNGRFFVDTEGVLHPLQ